MFTPLLTGVGLALATWVFGRFTQFERDRSFYPTIICCIAAFYVLFSIQQGTAIEREIIIASIFAIIAISFSFKFGVLIPPLLATHGLYDIAHHTLWTNPVAPEWWVPFCAGYDLILALLIWLFSAPPYGKQTSTASRVLDPSHIGELMEEFYRVINQIISTRDYFSFRKRVKNGKK